MTIWYEILFAINSITKKEIDIRIRVL